MSDPRNVAHAKKVAQEKKHQGTEAAPKKRRGSAGAAATPDDTAGESVAASESPTAKPPAALEGALTVLAKLKEMEFHSRGNLERLAELALTVEDELKQKEMAGPLGEVHSAQDAFQTKLTALIEAFKAECDRMQSQSG